MSGLPGAGAPANVRLPKKDVFAGRAVEQLALAASSLALAWRLGPEGFAPIGVLFVVNSLAATVADQGLGLRLMRLAPGAQIDRSSLIRTRWSNGAVTVGGIVASLGLEGDAGLLMRGGALIWAVSAEASVRKGAALRAGSGRRVATSEAIGATLLVAVSGVGAAEPSVALGWVCAGLVGKALVELGMARPWRWAFASAREERDWVGVWLSLCLAFAISNVDYLVVGLAMGDRALATYLLAFRISNAVPSQVAFVAARLATVDLASGEQSERQNRYERYTRTLFIASVAGLGATCAAAPVLERVLGDEWSGLAWALVIVTLAAPWRAVLGIAGTLAVVSNKSNRLMSWELLRLAGVLTGLGVSAAMGFGQLLVASVALAVGTAVIYHRAASRLAGLRAWQPLVPLALATLAALTVLATQGWRSLGAIG